MSQIVYRIITTIKNTEKSQVYLASMEGKENPVIIKRMNTANPEVYKVLSELHNEHLPQVYAIEWQENELVVAEEYVDGETLEYYLNEGLLTEEQKLKFGLQLCEAVEVLHNCRPQIIHRDIKPSNVLITEAGVLKLIDFDAARQYKKMSEDSDTRILGTADYAAPEQFGYRQTDVRSDIYSMGIVFEMLHFQGTGMAMFAWKQMLDICTNFDPKKRYKNANKLAKAIRRVMLLQKYQWYGLGCLLCVVFLIMMNTGWQMKPMDEGGKQPNTQSHIVTQETEMPPEDSLDSEMGIHNEGDETDEEKLALIKQMLELQSAYVAEYFQGEKEVDYLCYSDFFENDIKVLDATLIDLVSEERFELGNHLRFENSILMIDAEYMQMLKPSYYRLRLELIDSQNNMRRTHDMHIRVFSEKDAFIENEFSLETNYLDYHYEQYDTLHIILCPNTRFRVIGLHQMNVGSIDPSQYQILYDGRAMELSASLLEQCKNTKEIFFEVEFDNGKRERLTIANPYLQ